MTEPNGFYYMRARYYDPEVGRFISEDPIGFEGGDVNLMVYVGNNPILLMDPFGLRESSSGFQQSLQLTAKGAWVAATAAVFIPADTVVGEIVFGAIGLGATGLEKILYSENPTQDIALEGIKMYTNLPSGSLGPYTKFVNEGKNILINTGVSYIRNGNSVLYPSPYGSPSSNQVLRCHATW